jgi:hypothetical protein
MLNIIIGKDSKPTENYIHDAESLIPLIGIDDNIVSREILKQIERGEYLSKGFFIDRTGCKVSALYLSTGSKALLSINNTDKIINGAELGLNAFEFLIQNVNGNVYFDNVDRFELPEYFTLSNISVNGKVCNTVLELENELWKE